LAFLILISSYKLWLAFWKLFLTFYIIVLLSYLCFIFIEYLNFISSIVFSWHIFLVYLSTLTDCRTIEYIYFFFDLLIAVICYFDICLFNTLYRLCSIKILSCSYFNLLRARTTDVLLDFTVLFLKLIV